MKKEWRVVDLERFFALSPDLFCIADFRGFFKTVNASFESTLGFTKDELVAKPFIDFVHPDDRLKTIEEVGRLSLGVTTLFFENRYRCKDGTHKWLSWKAVSLVSEGVIYATARDVTRQKELEEENIEARKSAQSANQAKSDFLATMSHEIRTPLNAIIGMAEVLADTPLSKEQKKFVSVFSNAGNSLLNLINDILDLSRIEAGKIEIVSSPFNLKEVLEATVDLYAFRASQKHLELSFSYSDRLPLEVISDTYRVRQVLTNLISNAIKYSDKGKVHVEVEPSNSGKEIIFMVQDEGHGILAEMQARLFGKYERLTEDSKMSGTGLGLHICKKLVELMGGRIWFRSQEKEGSQFYFTLPLKAADVVTEAFEDVSPEKRKPLKILLVDDNEDNRLIVTSYLRRYPYQIEIAQNGQEAIEKFKQGGFNIVLMDIHMPQMDGLAATRVMREWEEQSNRSSTPIIALTAYALKEEAANSQAAGCNAHIPKPIQRDVLESVIRKYAG